MICLSSFGSVKMWFNPRTIIFYSFFCLFYFVNYKKDKDVFILFLLYSLMQPNTCIHDSHFIFYFVFTCFSWYVHYNYIRSTNIHTFQRLFSFPKTTLCGREPYTNAVKTRASIECIRTGQNCHGDYTIHEFTYDYSVTRSLLEQGVKHTSHFHLKFWLDRLFRLMIALWSI